MTADDLKRKMGSGQHPLFKAYTLTTEEGPVELQLRRPAPSTSERLMREAAAQGLLGGEEGVKSAPHELLAFQRKVVAATVYAPGALTPLYSEEEAGTCLYLGELFQAAMPALAAIGPAVESAKGN